MKEKCGQRTHDQKQIHTYISKDVITAGLVVHTYVISWTVLYYAYQDDTNAHQTICSYKLMTDRKMYGVLIMASVI